MRASTLLTVVALAVAMALATSLVGWPGVPVTAAVAAFVRLPFGRAGHAVTPGRVALAGALAWGGFLVVAAAGGRLGAVMALVGRVVGGPGALVVVLTLALPAVLAWAAAALGESLAALVRPTAGDPDAGYPPAGNPNAGDPPAADPITLRAPGQLGPPVRPAGADPEATPGSPAAATP